MEISLACLHCGSGEFVKPRPDYIFKDGEDVVCRTCGKKSSYTEMKRIAVENAVAEYAKANLAAIRQNARKVTDKDEIEKFNRIKKDAL